MTSKGFFPIAAALHEKSYSNENHSYLNSQENFNPALLSSEIEVSPFLN